MRILLLKYNKPHNQSLLNLSLQLQNKHTIIWGDLFSFGSKMNLLSFQDIAHYFSTLEKFDAVILGDIFWTTGQSICQFCKEKNIISLFLQHGQWIFTQNKKKLQYYPTFTLLFGDNVKQTCLTWPYSKYSNIQVIGCPRYDNAVKVESEDYFYFSPPVIKEIVHHNKPANRLRDKHLNSLKKIIGIDKKYKVLLQPHYREAGIDLLQYLFPKAQFVDPEEDPLLLVQKSMKVIGSRDSTIILDAIAYHKSVVLMDLETVGYFPRNYFDNFAEESNNFQEFIVNLNKDYQEPLNYDNEARKHILLGNASARISEILNTV